MTSGFGVVVPALLLGSVAVIGAQTPASSVTRPPVGEVVTPDGTRLHYEISGTGPTIVGLEWQKAFPRATLVPIGDAGHLPYLEQPAALLRAIDTFVPAHRPPG
jgi:hypothetical protein